MAGRNFEHEVHPYDIVEQLKADCGSDCLVINVGKDEHEVSVKSLRHLQREVELYILTDRKLLDQTTKLYVIGGWNFSFDPTKAVEEALDEASDPWTIVDQAGKLDFLGDDELTWTKVQTVTREEDEWKQGLQLICTVIKVLSNLKELTWISSLAFTEKVWSVLPISITKLVLDIGAPIKVDASDFYREAYISQGSMKPLTRYTKLEELRVFNMRDSFQTIIWETVFRNDSLGKMMHVLDLTMAAKPIVRQMEWSHAHDINGLTVFWDFDEGGNTKYRGNDGRGMLHHRYGNGEYLDYLAMRKARQASGPDETKPVPLWCLKLDGFVLDHLPFDMELSPLILLGCGTHCIDAGLRAPKTPVPAGLWSHMVKGASTHCMIVWPKWTGIFNAEGHLLDSEGRVVVGKEDGSVDSECQYISCPAENIRRHNEKSKIEDVVDKKQELSQRPADTGIFNEKQASASQVPLTTEALDNLALEQAIRSRELNADISTGYGEAASLDKVGPVPSKRTQRVDFNLPSSATPVETASNASVRGSPVPTSALSTHRQHSYEFPQTPAFGYSLELTSLLEAASQEVDWNPDNASCASTFGDSENPDPTDLQSGSPFGVV